MMTVLMGSGVSSTELTIFSIQGRPCTSVKCLVFLFDFDFLSAVAKGHGSLEATRFYEGKLCVAAGMKVPEALLCRGLMVAMAGALSS